MKKIKIKFNIKKIKKIFDLFAKYRFLLFVFFLFFSFLFAFKVVFNNAYLNVEFIDYKENENDIIVDARKVSNRMQIILDDIEKKKSTAGDNEDLEYVNPFKYNIREDKTETEAETNNIDYNKSNSSGRNEDMGIRKGF